MKILKREPVSVIKAFSSGRSNFYSIDNGKGIVTMIDCDLRKEKVENLCFERGIDFISTHPDLDHISGIRSIDDNIGIDHFYVVENSAYRYKDCNNRDVERYCMLRDNPHKAYYIHQDFKLGTHGFDFFWPDTNSKMFLEIMERVEDGNDYNDLSPIFTYSMSNGFKAMWMGDISTDLLDRIKDEVEWPKIDVLFAPHHGRKTSRVSKEILKQLSPQIIVIGNAPSEDIYYYEDFNTITQNRAGNVTFISDNDVVNVYVEVKTYVEFCSFLQDNDCLGVDGGYYAGSFTPYAVNEE